MHLSCRGLDGAYWLPRFTIAPAPTHVCTAGNRRAFPSAAVRSSLLAVAGGERLVPPPGDLTATRRPGLRDPRHGMTRESFPTEREFPASCHAIGPPLPHTELVGLIERTRCVIVDDNRDFLDAATRLLEHQGINVVAVAMSSAEGLQCVKDLQPDVTLVDIDLGEESGFDLVEKLHRNGFGAEMPTILISTHAEEDFAELVSASPAVAFIPKDALSGAAIRDALGLAG
jgi:CheY-like chemotaxis protein